MEDLGGELRDNVPGPRHLRVVTDFPQGDMLVFILMMGGQMT